MAPRATRTWSDQIDLLVEIGNAGLHLLRGGLAIARGLARRIGPALQDVGDVNCLALKTHGLDDLRQELPGLAHERFALLIFIRARSFADKHDLGIDVADTEYDVLARTRQIRALDASQSTGAQISKGGSLCLRAQSRADRHGFRGSGFDDAQGDGGSFRAFHRFGGRRGCGCNGRAGLRRRWRPPKAARLAGGTGTKRTPRAFNPSRC